VNDRIVRGLDYYNKTVFEVLTQDLGAQNTVGAGGRYDGLVSQFDGPDVPAVGFATGLERVIQTMLAQKIVCPKGIKPLVYFIPMGDEAKHKCFELATQCRHNHIAADCELQAKKVPAAIQNAVRLETRYACIIGSQEIQSGEVKIKDLNSREEKTIRLDQLIQTLKEIHEKPILNTLT
jgi:histidyl-tRNA synthetase